MIWYLLYPFRGSTEPPRLAPDHPIRKVFTRYGSWTARHWLVSILLSVTVAVFLCYPVLFLYDAPRLPHHVWTSAKVVDGEEVRPDVEMRQVWVHGNYMGAVEARVLMNALEIQGALVGDSFGMHSREAEVKEAESGAALSYHPDSPCTPFTGAERSWGFHSPLLYWNCSAEALEHDQDILATINEQSHRRSFLNFTLRPQSVFAGKAFAGKSLLAADALVITLFDRLGYGIGEEWDERCIRLSQTTADRLSFYPADGKVQTSHVFEFSFQPMSIRDQISLAVAYISMAFYVMISLRKLRAVKSRFGLVLTVISQITISIFASITICGLLNINLTQLPQEAYPFVVLVIGLENMFRLINAVLGKPAEMPTISRVSNALGDVGHLSLAAAGQNLMLLWLLSKVVWPGVAAFCAFAAVALIFDFVFHLTFFLAVLSVDVRRMELHESLEKANAQETSVRTSRASRQPWLDALLRNELPPSTRIAGSAILICFTLALNWHFDHQSLSLMRLLRWVRKGGKRQPSASPAPPPINQARTPAAWLRMQDYETAQEVVRFVKPNAHNFIARVYDPLTVVLKGADRAADAAQTPSLYRALWRFVEAHFFPLMLTVVFTIAVVTVLMNYLLWNELPTEEVGGDVESDLKIIHLPNAHSLDVVRLWANAKGHMVSVGLDRVITLWYCHPKTRAYSQAKIQPTLEMPKLWPIAAAAIDDTGTRVALCTSTGTIALFALPGREMKWMTSVHLDGQTPCGFGFITVDSEAAETLSLVIVTPVGRLLELDPLWPEKVASHSMEHGLTHCVNFVAAGRGQPYIASISRYTGELLITSKTSAGWVTSSVDVLQHGDQILTDDFFRIRHVHSVPSLGLLALVRAREVDLINSRNLKFIATVALGEECRASSSLRILHGPRRSCATCSAPAVHSLSFAYTDDQHQCIMRTFTASSRAHSALLCLRPASDVEEDACARIARAIESTAAVTRPGAWEATGIQAVVGLRRRPLLQQPWSGGGRRRALMPASGMAAMITGAQRTILTHGGGGGGGGAAAAAATDGRNSSSSLLHHRNGKHSVQASSASASASSSSAAFTAKKSAAAAAASSSSSSSSSSHAADSEDWECWMLTTDGEFQSTPLHPAQHAAPDHLYVTEAGPISRLGRRSVAVALGDSLKVVMLGIEKFDDGSGAIMDIEDLRTKGRAQGGRRKAKQAAAISAIHLTGS